MPRACGPGKGRCIAQKKFYGMATVTDKGQISVPMELQKELGINKGDKLLILKRWDNSGINLIKSGAIDEFLEKASGD